MIIYLMIKVKHLMFEFFGRLFTMMRMKLMEHLHLVHQIKLHIKLLGSSFDQLLDLLVWSNIKNEFHFVEEAYFDLSLFPFERIVFAFYVKHAANCFDDERYLGVVADDSNNYPQQDLLDSTNITQDGPDVQGGSGELVYTGIHGEPFDVEMCIIKAKMIRHWEYALSVECIISALREHLEPA